MSKRFITRVELSAECRDKLYEIHTAAGMTQVAVLSRLVAWLADQPDTVRALVLGQIPPSIEQEAARLVLSRIAQQSKGAA